MTTQSTKHSGQLRDLETDLGEIACVAMNDRTTSGGPDIPGYLNRITGEILYLWADRDAVEYNVKNPAADRAIVEANPADWIKIPKFDSFNPADPGWGIHDLNEKRRARAIDRDRRLDEFFKQFVSDLRSKHGIRVKDKTRCGNAK